MRASVGLRWVLTLGVGWGMGSGCAHAPAPGPRVHVISEDARGVGTQVEGGTGGAGADAYCNEIQKQCFNTCWRRKPEIDGLKKGSSDHYRLCDEKCLKVFMQCVAEQDALERQEARKRQLHFPTMDEAVVWIREHKAEVALGTVVIVGGLVAAPYVVAMVGGALILAPL